MFYQRNVIEDDGSYVKVSQGAETLGAALDQELRLILNAKERVAAIIEITPSVKFKG